MRLRAKPEARSALGVPDTTAGVERVGGCVRGPGKLGAALPHLQEHRLDGTVTRNTSVLLGPAPTGQLPCV